MFLKKYLIIFLALIASSCAFSFMEYPSKDALKTIEAKFDADVFQKGGKAYVIMDAYNNIPARFDVINYFVFAKENGEEVRMVINKEPTEFMLSPGTYTLKRYYLYGSQQAGNTRTYVDFDFENSVTGSFTVTAGEVTYLGRIETNITSVNKSFWGKATVNDVRFNTKVINKLSNLNDNHKNLIKLQSGKEATARLINWQQTGRSDDVK